SCLPAGLFPPQRSILRLDAHGYSPAALRLIADAAARLDSFTDAAYALSLARLSISAQHVHTLAQEIGNDLARCRDEKAAHGRGGGKRSRCRGTGPSAGPGPRAVGSPQGAADVCGYYGGQPGVRTLGGGGGSRARLLSGATAGVRGRWGGVQLDVAADSFFGL